MQTQIHRIPVGLVNCYLVRHQGTMLVDCALPGRSDALCRAIHALSIKPEEVNLIILTHGHFDHIGSACEMAQRTGARVAIHADDAKWLKSGRTAPASGLGLWGRLLCLVLPRLESRLRFDPLTPDIVVGNEDLALDSYGVPGKLVHTPGHTPGSMSLVLSDGSAFVGDIAMSGLPALTRWPGLPIFADDPKGLALSWRRLLSMGASTVYPGHGRPFAAGAMAPRIEGIQN